MIGAITSRARTAAAMWAEFRARRAVDARWQNGATGRPSDGGPPIVISLTSYRPRFATLVPTLKSLLRQTLPPEHVLLWVGQRDADALPDEVRAMETEGLRIMPREDLRSFTKFIHAVREYPEHRIAICDDDTWYRPHWLEQLATPLPAGQIACHRIHRIMLDPAGHPIAYNDWEQASAARDASPLNFPTGVGGVLFRPSQMAAEIVDAEEALRLCPSADDVWLYWMGRLAGSTFVRVGNNDSLVSWRGSQSVALWRTNNIGHNANDEQIRAMIERFGDAVFERSVDAPAPSRAQALA